jgi:hypothetical protein
MSWFPPIRLFSALALMLVFAPTARAILFYDTGDAAHNTSAPAGGYVNSGWQYEGYFGSYLGTMISPTTFITAQHIGVADDKFVADAVFTGLPTVTYNVDTTANGGTGYWDIAGTDLRIYQITGGTFVTFAQLYTGTADATAAFVDVGRGGPRGADVLLASQLKGFATTAADGIARWGGNTFTGTTTSGVGTLLVAHFDAVTGGEEFTLSAGDSGGGAFINDNGVWKLAGINYGVENGPYDADFNHTNGNEFSAALFDRTGYTEFNGTSWIPVVGASSLYLSRISDSAAAIQDITVVPEPGSGVFAVSAALVCLGRRRRTAARK